MNRAIKNSIPIGFACLAVACASTVEFQSKPTFGGYVFADTAASFAFSDTMQTNIGSRKPLWNADITIYSDVRSDSTFRDWAGYARTERNGSFRGRLTDRSVFSHLGAIVVRRNTYYTDTVFFRYSTPQHSWNFMIGMRKIDDPNIERAQSILASRDSGLFSFQRRPKSEWNDAERFSRNVASPLHNTTFYLFATDWMSPPIMSIFCSFEDSLCSLPRIPRGSLYADTVLISFLNRRLQQEATLDSSNLYRLATFYNDLLSDGEGSFLMLNSWEDIQMPDGRVLPTEIKTAIRPLAVKPIQGGYSATYFVRNIYSARLLSVTVSYVEKKIAVACTFLGNYGFAGMKM